MCCWTYYIESTFTFVNKLRTTKICPRKTTYRFGCCVCWIEIRNARTIRQPFWNERNYYVPQLLGQFEKEVLWALELHPTTPVSHSPKLSSAHPRLQWEVVLQLFLLVRRCANFTIQEMTQRIYSEWDSGCNDTPQLIKQYFAVG